MEATARQEHVTLPRLDVIRAFCFLAVFGCHVFYSPDPAITSTPFWHAWIVPLFSPGTLGVNVFFALSGFLITYLLIREKRLNGRIDVPRFWLRRILRIWPLYFAVVFIGFVVFQWIKARMGVPSHESADPWDYILFISNFPKSHGIEPDSSILTVLWSIAVEEQFYLVWPILLSVLPERRSPFAFGMVILLSIVFRWTHMGTVAGLWHTFSCMGDLAIGALGAWLVSRPHGPERVHGLPFVPVLAGHVLFVALYFFHDRIAHPLWPVFFRALFAAASTFIILYQAFGRDSFLKLPTFPALVRMGRISYGLYCLHQVAVLSTLLLLARFGPGDRLWHVVVLQPLIALPMSIVLAAISYRYLEKPFLRLKDRFAYIVRNEGAAT